jgi:PTH1 family peptidyl-tRNA hydrolase
VHVFRAIFGLGNPGRDYEETRHNAGFLVLDRLAETLPAADGAPLGPPEFKHIRRLDSDLLKTREAYLVKPTTYMNASGEAVAKVCRFYRIPADEILVVYDDMDLPLGRLRFRLRGSSGGHNGIKSIIQHLGSDQFPRLKVGIGRQRVEGQAKVIGHVLGRFSAEERPMATKTIERAADAVCHAMAQGVEAAMTRFHGEPPADQ